MEFAYRNQPAWDTEIDVPEHERSTDAGRADLVMDIEDSPRQATFLVGGAVISFLELSSFSDEHPRRIPTPDALV